MDAGVLKALREALARLPESDKKKPLAILGLSSRTYTLEELVEEYANDTLVGKKFGETLTFNTIRRLTGKNPR